MSTLHILLVTSESTRLTLRSLLDSQPDVRVVADVASLREAREVLAILSVDVVVFESSLGKQDGFELLPAIPLATRVICLTGDTADALTALAFGSLECVPLPIVPRIFLARLDGVRRGETIDPFAPMEYAEMGYRSIHCTASITT